MTPVVPRTGPGPALAAILPQVLGVWVLAGATAAQIGTVESWQKISSTYGGFGGELAGGSFGSSVAALGDLDGDGIVDLAVGAMFDNDGGVAQGAVWILFLNADGTVRNERKISALGGGFGGDLDSGDLFGESVAALGDLDGDGVTELAVGASGDRSRGAIWILFLNADGTVEAEQKINDLAGGFGGSLVQYDEFGVSACAVGDLDDDGVVDLAVGAYGDDDGGLQGSELGAVWILLLEPDGTVKAEQKITETLGGFGGNLDPPAQFGRSLDAPGDLDGDGVPDLAVGANGYDGFRGVVWVLFLEPNGTVKAEHAIGPGSGGFGGAIEPGQGFSWSVAALGDLDGDAVGDLAVGALFDGDGGSGNGAVWVLFLEGPPPCGTLAFESEDDFTTPLANGQHLDTEFGRFVTLTSSGPNQGLAIFDSSPDGPNDPSQDPDLLVGSGNILILQTENYPPDANDVFPRPNDDEDGGSICFTFEPAVEPSSLRLIDIDAGAGTSTVVLTDGSASQRSYTVPAGWTGDRTLSQPGEVRLDLTTLLAQPGFGSSATAMESAGFDATDVIQLDVHLGGSGALDDLCLCSPSLPRARVSARNGSGANPSWLRSATRPVLGSTWSADLDCRAYGSGFAILAVRSLPAPGIPSPFGELLVSGELLHRAVRPFSSATSRLTWDIPHGLALQGLEVHAQGLCRASTGGSAGKTLRIQTQLTNALDLELGF